MGRQESSRFFPRGDGDGAEPGLIGRVFFPFDDAQLDSEDCKVIEQVSNVLRMQLFGGVPIHVRIVGHADTRGAARYNLRLAERRANKVKQLLDSQLRGTWRAHTSVAISRGESRATGRHAYDRRVDIRSNYAKAHWFSPKKDGEIVVERRGPLSRYFGVKILRAKSGAVGPVIQGGMVSMVVEIINVKNKKTAKFSLEWGLSLTASPIPLPVSADIISEPTKYVRLRPEDRMALKHFEGPGGIDFSTATVLIFDGPRKHGVTTRRVVSAPIPGVNLSIGPARGTWKPVGR